MNPKLKSKILIVVAIAIGVGFLYLINLVVYRTTVLAFNINEIKFQILLGISLGFFSISFIAATIIGDWHYNVFTRVYYTLSAIWMGLLVYLFFASIIYEIIYTFSQPSTITGPVILIVVVLLGTYGIIRAQKIIIKKVSISLQNFPNSWKDKKIVWVSDLHLGQIHGPKFAQEITEKVSALSPDIIFIGGDLYDGTGAPDIQELTMPLKKLVAPLGVYFVTGNHEEYGDYKRFLSAVESVGIYTLKDEMIEIEGIQIIGIDHKNALDLVQYKETLSKFAINREKVSILLKHEPRDLDIAHDAGISFQISGHTHNGQMWPLGYIAQITYKGFAYGLKYYKNMLVYTSSGTGTWGPPISIGTNREIVLFTLNKK